MKILIKDILTWIKNPNDIALDIKLKTKVFLLFQMLLLDIVIATMIAGLTYLIHMYVIKLDYPLIDEAPLLLLVLAVFFLPFVEEIIFRLPLKYKRNYLFQIADSLIGNWIKNRWKRFFKYFMYFMVLAFGLIHLTNYTNTEPIFYCLAPIIVGSQILGGFILSYTRIKLGFIWAFVQHGLFNLFGIIMTVLFFHNHDIMNISTPEYNLKITELAYIYVEDSYYDSDFDGDVFYSIDAEDVSLQSIIDNVSMDHDEVYDDVWVDFYFESKDGIDSKEIIKLIKENIKFED